MIFRSISPQLVALALLGFSSSTPAQIALREGAKRPSPEVIAARLTERLPKVSALTAARLPLHIALIGDSVTRGYLYEPDTYNVLRTYSGVFAEALTREFFYTGGVRAVNPSKQLPKKSSDSFGPEITLENFSRNGADVFYGLLPLSTGVFDNSPDLVLLNFGINDGIGRLPLRDYEAACAESIRLARAGGAEVLLVGAPMTLHPTARIGLGAARGQSAILRKLAAQAGVTFVPAGAQMLADLFKTSEVRAPEVAFAAIERTLAPLFVHPNQPSGIAPDRIHPNWEGHAAMGKAVAKGLLGESTEPTAPATLIGSVSASGETAVSFVGKLTNTSAKPLKTVFCPLSTTIALDIDPASAPDIAIDLAPGASAEIRFTLQRRSEFEGAPAIEYLDSTDASGRSAVITGLLVGKTAVYVDCDASIRPISGGWERGAEHFLSAESDITFTAVSPGTTIAVPYSASALDARVKGRFNLTGQDIGTAALALRFPALPVGGRMKIPLTLAFGENGSLGSHKATAEIVRNLGLGQRVPLYPVDRYLPGRTPDAILDDPESPGVLFRAEADTAALYLTYDITNTELVPAPFTAEIPEASVRVDIRIDARPHDTRSTLGMSPSVTIKLGHKDGLGVADARPTGTFGNGYDRVVDKKNIRAALETRGNGTRRITIVIPRAYFYNHPWALGNGNSTLGINTAVSLYQGDLTTGGYPPESTFVLASPTVKREDARYFPQLELTNRPTPRWSIFVY